MLKYMSPPTKDRLIGLVQCHVRMRQKGSLRPERERETMVECLSSLWIDTAHDDVLQSDLDHVNEQDSEDPTIWKFKCIIRHGNPELETKPGFRMSLMVGSHCDFSLLSLIAAVPSSKFPKRYQALTLSFGGRTPTLPTACADRLMLARRLPSTMTLCMRG